MSTQHATIPEFDITDRLRKAREIAGLTQQQLATEMGVAKTTVSNYEAGATTNHRTIVLNAWSAATGVPVAWLRWGVTVPDDPSGLGNHQKGCIADWAVILPEAA